MQVYSDIVDSVDEELGEEDMVRQFVARRNGKGRQKARETDRAMRNSKLQEEGL